MYKRGHIGLNLIIAGVFLYASVLVGELHLGFLGAGMIIATARVPDRDAHFDPNMDYFWGNSLTYQIPIKHRGRVHSLGFAILVGAIIGGLAWYLPTLAGIESVLGVDATAIAVTLGLSTVIGIFGHLLGDVVTKQPIPILWPFSRKKRALGLFYSKSQVNLGVFYLGAVFFVAVVLIVANQHGIA